MIIGAHVIVYSKDAEADRAFLRDILQLGSVDVGAGWLIFGLPPAEVAVHPSAKNDLHELYLMCDDVVDFIRKMLAQDIPCSPIDDQGWGLLTSLTLPGGGKLGVYQPRHERPEPAAARPAKQKAPRASGKTPAKKPRQAPAKKPRQALAKKPRKTPAKKPRQALAKKPRQAPAKKPAKTLASKPAQRSSTTRKKATKGKATAGRRARAR